MKEPKAIVGVQLQPIGGVRRDGEVQVAVTVEIEERAAVGCAPVGRLEAGPKEICAAVKEAVASAQIER